VFLNPVVRRPTPGLTTVKTVAPKRVGVDERKGNKMSPELKMLFRYTEMEKELKVISKWFLRNHGGPEVDADDVEDAALRSLTNAMADRRSLIGKQMREIEDYAAKNGVAVPE